GLRHRGDHRPARHAPAPLRVGGDGVRPAAVVARPQATGLPSLMAVDGAVRSPSVGRVLEVLVAVGAIGSAEQEVVVVESMKVEIPVVAPHAGRVASVAVAAGAQVQAGDLLLTIA